MIMEEDRFLLDMIKKEINNIIPNLNNVQDLLPIFRYINDVTQKLYLLDDNHIKKIIKTYHMDQDALQVKIEDKQKEIDQLNKEYFENMKQIIETIKRL
jgi:hypothetical protein